MRRDLPIAIGAVGFRDNAITFGDAYEVVLKQGSASADANILIHGIGGQMQLAGRDPALAMLEFVEYAGSSPLVAFRAEFDQSMLVRAARTYLGVALSGPVHRSRVPAARAVPERRVQQSRRLARAFRPRGRRPARPGR
jgi:DNA polymerase-3 subunit epsilon